MKKNVFSLGLAGLFMLMVSLALLTSCEDQAVEPIADVSLKAAGDCGWCGSYPYCCSGNVDPDGDGWGWEWSRSCIVKNSGPAQQTCNNSGGGGTGSVGCPSSLSCPSGMNCGCYTVSGLGNNKKALTNAGASRYMLAAAMMETELMNTNYTYGDGKSGDSFNAGRTKLNYYEARMAGVGQGSTSALWNKCSSASGDVQVWNACKSYWGSKYWAVHRNGESGSNNPNTQDINNFKNANDWTDSRIGSNSAYSSNDVRFWVQVPAI